MIERQVGTVQDMVDIFVQDATVSTGAGLPNLVISTFSSYYHRSDMTSTSSVTLVSTGTMGTWSSGQFLQINSTFMRGWYQFCNPNGLFAAGSTVALHMYGHPSMAPVVMRYDVTRFNNQRYVSSEPHNIERIYQSAFVTSAAGVVAAHVTSMSLRVGVSTAVDVTSFSGNAVTVTEGKLSVDVSTFFGSRVVTTAAGTLGVGRVGVSSFGLPVGVSSFDSRVGVSSFGLPVGVSTIQVGVSTSWFSGGTVVTSVAGVLASHVTSMRIAIDAQIVDRLLGRNVSSGADGGRTVAEALYVLRNRTEISGGSLTVYHTDDTASSWTAAVSTTAGDPISGLNPD